MSSPRVAIVNERLAREMFKGADPIGRILRQSMDAGQTDRAYEIVGLAGDAKVLSLREETYPGVYLAAAQESEPPLFMRFVVRGTTGTSVLTADVEQTIARLEPHATLRFDAMQTRIDQTLLAERLMATLSGCFGILAGVLAVVGLYGLVAYMAARRQGEIGVRLALGAQRRDILQMILGEVALLLAIGLAVGIPLALAAGYTARTLLFGLEPYDATTMALAVGGLAAAGLLASGWPALRASRIDPVTALRES